MQHAFRNIDMTIDTALGEQFKNDENPTKISLYSNRQTFAKMIVKLKQNPQQKPNFIEKSESPKRFGYN